MLERVGWDRMSVRSTKTKAEQELNRELSKPVWIVSPSWSTEGYILIQAALDRPFLSLRKPFAQDNAAVTGSATSVSAGELANHQSNRHLNFELSC